jgi:hypothetical protein
VSGTDNPVYWECTSHERPPATLVPLLKDDENLHWAARLSRTETVSRHLVEAMLTFAAAVFFAAIAPWTQTVVEYCGPEPSGRCNVFAYIVWPAVAFLIASSLWSFWSVWRATSRPWMITYGLSDKRAFFVDERRPKSFRYVYLRLNAPKLVNGRSLAFEGHSLAFVGLPPDAAARAFHWATTGRTTESQA